MVSSILERVPETNSTYMLKGSDSLERSGRKFSHLLGDAETS